MDKERIKKLIGEIEELLKAITVEIAKEPTA